MEYQDILSVLTILLLSSATVERFLEFFKKALESLGLFSKKTPQSPTPSSQPISQMRIMGKEITRLSTDTAEGDPSNLVLIEVGDVPDRNEIAKIFSLQVSGCVLGIILCWQGDLALFKMLKAPLGTSFWATSFDYILTGILIGTGTAPVHALIRLLQAKRELSQAQKSQISMPVAEVAPAERAVISAGHPLVEIKYFGGVAPEKLQNRIREKNPDTIVYHHTGMNSNLTFTEITRIIQGRGFETGFHAIIMPDGTCESYCRWDAVGIHSNGHDSRSLGLAFSGCFESNPTSPGNNSQGEMGNIMPTDAQIVTGAKLVSLWALIYGIDLNQPDRFLPHKSITPNIANQTCPGSEFPYSRFEMLTREIWEEWKNSPQVAGELIDFTKKQYLFVTIQP
ncbi:N-acetylmuramoyl-L-alanine amidase [candidate division KSB1 bacterium]|nr:N-acetylmuramoyl-L-alanine amidase [candidate division KSB1 bacterium]